VDESIGGVDALLAKSRAGARRLTAQETVDACARGALMIDTRTETQRRRQGDLPGALVIDRTVLEWRLDPTSATHIPEAASCDVEIVVVCGQGYSSSLAAASLRSIGLWKSTDMIGGAEAWIAANLPLTTEPADVRE
jgi:rhodanese-related sulfurtransferase